MEYVSVSRADGGRTGHGPPPQRRREGSDTSAAPGPLSEAGIDWLDQGHRRHVAGPGDGAPPSGTIGDRDFAAHPSDQTDGTVVWWLVDDTDQRLARQALQTERQRSAFLGEASNALLSSLNLERCMDVTAELAARHLADAALVITPRTGKRYPVVTCLRDMQPHSAIRLEDPEEVPGLAEALQGFPRSRRAGSTPPPPPPGWRPRASARSGRSS